MTFLQRYKPKRLKITPPIRARLLAMGLTLFYLLWILFHWVYQPPFFRALPYTLDELLTLLEFSGALTLVALWGAIYWHDFTVSETVFKQPKRESLYDLTPAEFEATTADFFRKKGFRVELRGRAGDMGVDIELYDGLRKSIVQCKRYRSTVGPDVVRELYGTLMHEQAYHGYLVTTANISKAAREWAKNKPLSLIDGKQLVKMMNDEV